MFFFCVWTPTTLMLCTLGFFVLEPSKFWCESTFAFLHPALFLHVFAKGSFNLNFISMIQRFKPMNFFAQVLLVTGCFDCTPKKKHGFSPLYKSRFLAIPSQEFLGTPGAFNALLRRTVLMWSWQTCEAVSHRRHYSNQLQRWCRCGRRDTRQESGTPEIPWWFFGKLP